MMYKVELADKAKKELKKLDKPTAKIILAWLRKNLEDCNNPRLHGKALVGDKKGYWRYRVGDYRIIADIQDDKILILVLEIGHRKSIYH